MDSLVLLFYPVALFVGLYIALRQKKDPAVSYSALDKTSVVLNVLLVPIYGLLSFLPMFLSMIFYPTASANALQHVLCWLFSGLIGAAPVYCAAALGLSAAWRRKGQSKKGFWIQFAGIPGIVIPLLIAAATDYASIPWMNTSLN